MQLSMTIGDEGGAIDFVRIDADSLREHDHKSYSSRTSVHRYL
ncbi:MAG: hypothetical protein ACOC38_01720 [Promethearchaeia archaeon]